MSKFARKTVYIYEINGQEKLTITNPDEASHWDAVFETAEKIDTWMQSKPPEIKLDETQRTDLCLYLAENRAALLEALGGEATPETSADDSPAKAEQNEAKADSKPDPKTDDKKPEQPPSEEKPNPNMKKQSFVQEFKRPVPPSKDGFSL